MEEKKPISSIQYPPGIRFQPSDEELISYYLERKVKSLPLPANVITDIELYNYNPWDLPRKTLFGEDEWYFFTPRDRKYPNGGRPNRTTASGYWKATGTDKPILSSCISKKIGVKKVLVFYQGKPPNGQKMDWKMTEYRLPEASRPSSSKGSMRLDDWVLCRIRQKGNKSKNEQQEDEHKSHEFCKSNTIKELPSINTQESRDKIADYLQSSEHHQIVSLLAGYDPAAITIPTTAFQSPNSGKLHQDESEKTNFYLTQSSSEFIMPPNVIINEGKDLAYQSGQMAATTDSKPNYASNVYFNYLEELDLPALQENFLK